MRRTIFDHSFLKGGEGSGNFGHSGRPGEIGGSGPGGGVTTEGKSPIPSGRQWIEKVPGLPDDTLQTNTNSDGSIKPERLKLHQDIINRFTADVPKAAEGQELQAIVMMGATASGKSSIANGIDKSGLFVLMNADEVKEHIPEYKEAVGASARNAAAMVHEESSLLAKQIRDKAIANRQNIVIDATGKDADKFEKQLMILKKAGYKIHLIMPDLDPETGMKRALMRAEKRGRYVPPQFVKEAYENVPKNFPRIAKLANTFRLYDNRGAEPRLVWSGSEGNETIHDEEFVRNFKLNASR